MIYIYIYTYAHDIDRVYFTVYINISQHIMHILYIYIFFDLIWQIKYAFLERHIFIEKQIHFPMQNFVAITNIIFIFQNSSVFMLKLGDEIIHNFPL